MRPSRHRIPAHSAKRSNGTPGGEWNFMWRGQAYSLPGRFLQDPKSPDGQRWVAAHDAKPIIRRIVHDLAAGACELKLSSYCWKRVSLFEGEPHHVQHCMMGGAYTDDRIWIGDIRMRKWACHECHREHHGLLAWTTKSERIA